MSPNFGTKAISATTNVGVHDALPVRAIPTTHAYPTQQFNAMNRRLFERDHVTEVLALSDEAVQQLIDTKQITAIRIAGQERFDSMEVFGLIDSYKRTAMRHATAS